MLPRWRRPFVELVAAFCDSRGAGHQELDHGYGNPHAAKSKGRQGPLHEWQGAANGMETKAAGTNNSGQRH